LEDIWNAVEEEEKRNSN
jgi:hypothetical protein